MAAYRAGAGATAGARRRRVWLVGLGCAWIGGWLAACGGATAASRSPEPRLAESGGSQVGSVEPGSAAGGGDDDADGVPDDRDLCPRDPEQWNGYDDEDGCPDRSRDVVVCTVVPPPLHFELEFEAGGTEPVGKTDAVLEALVLTLSATHFERVEVRGHTRQDAGPGDLALERADSVVQELVSRGVRRDKLRGVGFRDRCRDRDVVDFRPLRYAGEDVTPDDECDRWPGETAGRPKPCLGSWFE